MNPGRIWSFLVRYSHILYEMGIKGCILPFDLPPKSPIWGTSELRSLSFLGLISARSYKVPRVGGLGGIKTGKTFQLLIRI
jgi:hypothetical protein